MLEMDTRYERPPFPEFVLLRDRPRRSLLPLVLYLLGALTLIHHTYVSWFRWTDCGRPPSVPKIFRAHSNWPAYLEYGWRMRTGYSDGCKFFCRLNRALIYRFKRGEHLDALDDEIKEYLDAVLESNQQLKMQEVPDLMQAPHKKICKAQGLCYESVYFLREAHHSSGPERAKYLREAEKKMKEGRLLGDEGVRQFVRIWTQSQRVSSGWR